jgi:hypothetical protein
MWIKPIQAIGWEQADRTVSTMMAEGFALRIRNSQVQVDGLVEAAMTAVARGTANPADVERLRDFCRTHGI